MYSRINGTGRWCRVGGGSVIEALVIMVMMVRMRWLLMVRRSGELGRVVDTCEEGMSKYGGPKQSTCADFSCVGVAHVLLIGLPNMKLSITIKLMSLRFRL